MPYWPQIYPTFYICTICMHVNMDLLIHNFVIVSLHIPFPDCFTIYPNVIAGRPWETLHVKYVNEKYIKKEIKLGCSDPDRTARWFLSKL